MVCYVSLAVAEAIHFAEREQNMTWFSDLMNNFFLITALSSWLIAQILKMFIHAAVNRKFDFKRVFGDGGMPSGHSATVTSMAVLSAFVYGTGSFQFAISSILAIIVCHDAMGVRRETGKQAVIINEIIKSVDILASESLPEAKLKEFVGHTPVQVFSGVLLGAINAFFMYFVIM